MGWMLALGNLNIWMIKPNKIMAVAIAFNTFSARRLCSNMGKAGRLSRHHAENDIPNLCIFRFIFLFSLFLKNCLQTRVAHQCRLPKKQCKNERGKNEMK